MTVDEIDKAAATSNVWVGAFFCAFIGFAAGAVLGLAVGESYDRQVYSSEIRRCDGLCLGNEGLLRVSVDGECLCMNKAEFPAKKDCDDE